MRVMLIPGVHEPPKAAKEHQTSIYRHVVIPHALRSYLIWKTFAVPHKRQFVFQTLRNGLLPYKVKFWDVCEGLLLRLRCAC